MRIPIAAALHHPARVALPWGRLDLAALGRLEFFPPDHERFPALRLACDALARGGTAPAVLNAANEVAVQAFLDRRIAFTAIPALVAATLARVPAGAAVPGIEEVLAVDRAARTVAGEILLELDPPRRN
jgi:1-deoxy-D-xylulose-5-phosphate reductoisomerase